jgi:hypothetical protein
MNVGTTDLVVIIAMVVIGVVLAVVAWRRLSGRSGLPEIDDTPDRPVRFGWKMHWLGVPSDDVEAVVAALREADTRFARADATRCNWRSAMDRILANFLNPEVFVSPPVDGWVLLLNWQPDDDDDLERFRDVLEGLSESFGEAYAFGSHRVVSMTTYGVARDGQLLRCVVQADGESFIDHGEKLEAERQRDILTMGEAHELLEEASDQGEEDEIWQRVPDEQTVLDLAAEWSIDPSTLEDVQEKGVGRLMRPF